MGGEGCTLMARGRISEPKPYPGWHRRLADEKLHLPGVTLCWSLKHAP